MKTLLVALFLGLSVTAHEKHDHKKREHAVHQHGAAHLSIAFEAAVGKIEFKSPAESIFGFEHLAKTDNDKKIVNDKLASFEKKIESLIVFDQSSGCKITKEKISIVPEKHNSNHSDVEAIFNVVCAKSPIGKEVVFNIQGEFQRIKNIQVQVIADNVQKSLVIKKSGTKLQIQ